MLASVQLCLFVLSKTYTVSPSLKRELVIMESIVKCWVLLKNVIEDIFAPPESWTSGAKHRWCVSHDTLFYYACG